MRRNDVSALRRRRLALIDLDRAAQERLVVAERVVVNAEEVWAVTPQDVTRVGSKRAARTVQRAVALVDVVADLRSNDPTMLQDCATFVIRRIPQEE